MSAPAGAVNAWKCDACGSVLVAIHVVQGVTPMFLACRAPGCDGRTVSAGYPPPPVPPALLAALAWEWRLPTITERKRWKRENPAMLDHVRMGGLVLGPLTAAGAKASAEHHQHTPTVPERTQP